MDVSIYKSLSELETLAEDWDRLRLQEPRYFPNFEEARYALRACECRILVARAGSAVIGIAAFVNARTKKDFKVGERVLFRLPIRVIDLYGSSVLGPLDRDTMREILQRIVREWSFDLINLGEIIIDSPLHRAASSLKGGFIATRSERKDAIHWLIRFSRSFDEYLDSLTSKARRNAVYYSRKFEKEFPVEFQIVQSADQIDRYLLNAEQVNRLTYKWKLGQNVRADDAHRERYSLLASGGHLRCYIAYVDGQPCAFMGGQLRDGVYMWETSGYDPGFQKSSPGTVLLTWAIRDLIENTDCKILDFGSGGDDRDYKSKFANMSINCTWLQLGRTNQPYSLFLMILQAALSFVKNLMNSIIVSAPLRRRLKKKMRQYGDA